MDTTTKTKQEAVLVDVDGTLANVTSILHLIVKNHPKNDTGKSDYAEFHRQSQNCPSKPDVVEEVSRLKSEGYKILIVTGRSDDYRHHTESWLDDNEIEYDKLFMRKSGDRRPSAEVKKEILDEISEKWDPIHAFDDDPSVIEMFGDSGLVTTLIPGWQKGL